MTYYEFQKFSNRSQLINTPQDNSYHTGLNKIKTGNQYCLAGTT